MLKVCQHRGGQELKNSMHFEEIGELSERSGRGSGNGEFDALWRNRRNGWPTSGWGQEMENSMHFGEIGEMRGPIRGGSGLENSVHYGEIGEIK